MSADGPYLTRPVDLSALADRSGAVDWGRLAAFAAGSDVVVGEVLDEELVLCRGLAGFPEEPDPHWTPYLWPLSPSLRALSTRTVERLDVAHEVIEYPEDAPEMVECNPLLGGVIHAFEQAVTQLTWHHGPGEQGGWAGAALVLDGGVALHDDVDTESGQHVLVFRSLDREAVYVAGALDPDGRAGDGRSPSPGSPTSEPDLQRLTASAVTHTTLQRGPVWRSASPELTVRAFGAVDGLWLLENDGPPGTVTEPQRVSAVEIDHLALRLLTPIA